jgi:MATE family multidrug resistance protein
VSLKVLLALAWPLVISRMSQVVVGLTEAVLVAGLGPAALAATATGATNTFTFLILPMGTVFILSSFTSQLFGKGDLASARRFAWYGLGIALATEVLCLSVGPFSEGMLSVLPYEPEVRHLMAKYLWLRLTSGGAAIGIEALANYYGGLSRTRPGMAANTVAMGLNVVFSWALIGGHLGAPALGVEGAAIAGAVATWIAFLGFFGWFLLEGRTLPRPTLALHELKRVLRFGLPSGLNWFLEFLAFSFFVNVVVAGLGTTALAAMNSVLLLNSMSFMPSFGLASAGAILVGQAIGRGAKDEVPKALWLTVRTACVWQGGVGLLYLAVPHLLMVPFARGEHAAELTEVGVKMLFVSALWQLFDATATVIAESLRAAGDTLVPMVARLAAAWAIFAPGAWVSVRVFNGGEVIATAWLAGYLALLAVILTVRFRQGAWRNVELIEPNLVES